MFSFIGVCMNGIKLIKDQLEKAFYGGAWHGPSVLEALENISAEKAASKPVKNAHSIWEIALHINAWRFCAQKRLSGEEYEPSPEEDWPEIKNKSKSSWERTISNLKESMTYLIEFLSKLDENILNEKIAGKEYTYYFLLHGLVQHEVYHAGQIMLLKKALN
jgi:uncharacterized damage-inducible protein DinB